MPSAPSPTLDRHSVVPLYRQLAGHLLGLIDSGALAAGQRLSSEPDLMTQYGVSRITVRQAIGLLAKSGKLVTQRGRGTYVASQIVRHELDALQGFHQSLRSQGIEPQTTLVDWSPDAGTLSGELPPGMALPVRLRRLYAIDGRPFAVVTGYLPSGAAGLGKARAARLTVYEILSQFLGVKVNHADVTIRCQRVARDIAQLLGLPRSGMVLLMERQSFDAGGGLCEFMRIHILPERYEFRLRVTGEMELARAVHRVATPRHLQGARP